MKTSVLVLVCATAVCLIVPAGMCSEWNLVGPEGRYKVMSPGYKGDETTPLPGATVNVIKIARPFSVKVTWTSGYHELIENHVTVQYQKSQNRLVVKGATGGSPDGNFSFTYETDTRNIVRESNYDHWRIVATPDGWEHGYGQGGTEYHQFVGVDRYQSFWKEACLIHWIDSAKENAAQSGSTVAGDADNLDVALRIVRDQVR